MRYRNPVVGGFFPDPSVVRRRVDDIEVVTARAAVGEGALELSVRANPWAYEFSVAGADETAARVVDKAQSQLISVKVAGGFTGMYLAVYAQGKGPRGPAALDVDWFEYEPIDEW